MQRIIACVSLGILTLCITGFSLFMPPKVQALSGYFFPLSGLSLTVPAFSLSDTYLVIPFLISKNQYDALFGAERNPTLGFRIHINQIQNNYEAIRILDLKADEVGLVRSLKKEGDATWRPEWYRITSTDRFLSLDTAMLPAEAWDYHLVGVKIPAGQLSSRLQTIPSLDITYRFFDAATTYERASIKAAVSWLPFETEPLLLNETIESYIQTGTLTCEFASVKNALDMLGIVVDERRDLIPRFPQGDTKDPALDPREVFLGEYGFGSTVPQAFHVTAGPLGGYGLHLSPAFLTKVIHPFAPAAQVAPFSFSTLDLALSFHIPVIVQGIFFDAGGNPRGGTALRLNQEDRRGMVVGEHTFTIFGKTDDGFYRIKDPFKRNFLALSKDAVERSVELFGQYGAGKNMILMLPHEVPTLASTYLLQGTDGTLREVSE